jgi:hypothetical protein
MNFLQISGLLQLNADTGSFLFGMVIAILFYFKYKELEAEAAEREFLENFLNDL